MKPHLLTFAALIAIGAMAHRASAESWIFRPSYFSHDPTSNVRIGRQFTSSPAFSRPMGGYYSGGWRWQHNQIIVGGQMFDNYNYFESWGQQGQKF